MTASEVATAGRPPELRALTGMRGIAAWWVVLYHIRFSIAGLPPTALAVLAKGYLAVDFFFLLSGFVIWLSWIDRFRSDGRGAIGAFLWKRLARVWPLHLFILGCAVCLAALLSATGRADPVDFPWAELPLHVFLVQNWWLTDGLAWNVPAWSISAEFAAYLVFPALALAIDWRRVPSALLIAVAAALLLVLHVAMAGVPTLGSDIARFGVVRCLAEFTVGSVLAALWLRWKGDRTMLAPCAIVAAIAVCGWRVGIAETLAVPAAFAAGLLALALTAGARGHPLEGRAIHELGSISYATYLGHFLLWHAWKLAFVADQQAIPHAVVAAYLLAVLASSLLLYHGLERPAQRWLDQRRAAWFIPRVRRPALPPAPR